MDIKTVLSYNIKNNIDLEVKYNDANTIKGINLEKSVEGNHKNWRIAKGKLIR